MHEVLDELGARTDLLAPQQLSELDELGFCRFDDFLTADQVAAALAEIEALSPDDGEGTLHLKARLEAGTVFDPLWLRPRLLAAVRHLLGPEFHLSAMRYGAGRPELRDQAPRLDFQAGAGRWRVCTAIAALVDFTARNGATRVVPGSHLDHGFVPPADGEDHPDQVLLLGRAGTAWLCNSHLWIAGTVNRSSSTRHAVQTGFTRRCGSAAYDVRPPDETISRLGNAAYLLV
ncbi:phytanoyl-CoA dioxygenase family protein [Actinokineospora enzanensis]|uniref:phytanoyl-CoA dioxygenase family protein n=1 Tax=Actinokineospora enzanensis TaxID=155975 RepID=UPI00036A7501|nr:phytanoyl-CoA dioxygenase family protein [Actinokineospora enzanensis]